MMVFLRQLRELTTRPRLMRCASATRLPAAELDSAPSSGTSRPGSARSSTPRSPAEQLGYWRERLADPPEPMALAYDRTRPARQTFRGDQVCVDLRSDVAERLRHFARAQGVTPFMTMLAAFCVLLQRYSGAGDVIVGSGMANRRLRELDDMLGMFINTVALRVDLSDDPSVTELLGRVRAAVLEGQANQDVPFPRVVEAVAPSRSSSHTPLYQTLFSFADAPLPDLSAGSLEIVPDETPGNGSAKAEVNVVVVNHDGRGETPTEPTIIWEYNSDLFSAATAERMVRDYCRLLESLVSEPGGRASALQLLARLGAAPPAGRVERHGR